MLQRPHAGAQEELLLLLGRPEVARGLAKGLVVELQVMARNGVPFPGWATPVLRCLRDLAGTGVDLGSAVGTGSGTVSAMSVAVSEGWVSVGEAAGAVGRSREYLRRLARTGRVRGVQVGPGTWLVELASVRSVLARAGLKVRGGAA